MDRRDGGAELKETWKEEPADETRREERAGRPKE